jgi:hypothetical protein
MENTINYSIQLTQLNNQDSYVFYLKHGNKLTITACSKVMRLDELNTNGTKELEKLKRLIK